MAPGLSDNVILSATEKDASIADRNTHATRVAGKGADPEKKALLSAVTKRIDYSPRFGTELHGIRLSQLTDQQSEELAALIAERGVVFFRDQDDFDTKEHIRLGSRWGYEERSMQKPDPLHIHPLVPHNQETPEIIVLDSRLTPANRYNTNNYWHSDVSFEPAPSSFSILKFDEIPEAGGDTVWSNGYQLYDDLSQPIKTLLEGLTATHTSDIFRIIQANTGRKTFGKLNDAVHPVVRTNPVTGWKAIFTNSVFTREINGVSPTESKWILDYLNDLISKRLEYQVRFKWAKNSVAIWDNRSSHHSAVPDFKPYNRRGYRVTVSGEVPYYDPKSGTQAEAYEETAKAHVGLRRPCARGSSLAGCPAPSNGQYIDYDLNAPIGTSSSKNAPLCKQTKKSATRTIVKAGGSISTTYSIGAAHGGGHCQWAISFDDKKWVVVKTIIRDCLKDTSGEYTVSVPIPKNAPSGKATLMWLWNNAIGNRELYSNCADIEIQGGSKGGQISGVEPLIANYGPGSLHIEEFGGSSQPDQAAAFSKRKSISINISLS
ncbi:hypothetical protein BGZ76_002820 [Entomortierella beljakovae]|nr:hypothetical protein BGZ76_002820 [Entomortierella beljakovae]